MTNSPSKHEFDALKMYFRKPMVLSFEKTEKIIVKQPSIGEIIEYGEQEFFSMLNIFVSNPTFYRLSLWDKGIDWNTITDYELFCTLIKRLKKDDTSILFEDVNFEDFVLSTKDVENEQIVTLYNPKQNIELDENSYFKIAEYFRFMFNTYPKVEKARGKQTKLWMIEEDREKQELNKDKGYSSILLPLVSSCVNHPGFKYKTSELEEIGIFEFMDSVQRLQIYESSKSLNIGLYSGMRDLSKVDKSSFNFMRDIYKN